MPNRCFTTHDAAHVPGGALQLLIWTAALAVGLLWPARTLSVFDGMPLDGRIEAVTVGLIVPALWWLDRAFVVGRWPKVLIALLVMVKMTGMLLPQEGLCASFGTGAWRVGKKPIPRRASALN